LVLLINRVWEAFRKPDLFSAGFVGLPSDMDGLSKTLHRDSATADDYLKLNQKAVLKANEAALLLNVSDKTVRRLTNARVIPSFKLGRFTMYSRVALIELIAKKGGLR
jgi:excisionase family DNA binding protein